MKLTADTVKKVAKLANLPLSDSEVISIGDQLSKILDYIDQLNAVDTKDVAPTFNTTPNTTITRPDKVNTSLTQDQALKNASQQRDGFFVTKGVFEE